MTYRRNIGTRVLIKRLTPFILMVSLALAGAQQPAFGGTLRVALPGVPDVLDIHKTNNSLSYNIMSHVYETLFAFDGSGQPQPMLASSYEASADGLTHTIGLRQGLTFHDGTDLTSQDVIASLERWGSLSGFGRTFFAMVDSVEAADNYTIVIQLNSPVGIVPTFLSNRNEGPLIYTSEAVETFGDETIQAHVGTGPYRFIEEIPDFYIKLERFDGYQPLDTEASGSAGQRVAYVDEIRFYPIPEDALRVAGIEAGDYDVGYFLPIDDYARLSSMRNIVPVVSPQMGMSSIRFNMRAGIMTDQKVRQAFLAALDLNQMMLAQAGSLDFYSLGPSLMPVGTVWESDVGAEFVNQSSPERAMQLLAESSYDGEPIRWLVGREPEYQTALVAKQQLEAAGFTIDLQYMEWGTMFQVRNDAAAWDTYSSAFLVREHPVLLTFVNATSAGWWDDSKKEQLLAAILAEPEFSKQKEMWDEVQGVFWDSVPMVKVGDYHRLGAHRSTVINLQNTVDPFFWNVWLADVD